MVTNITTYSNDIYLDNVYSKTDIAIYLQLLYIYK